MAKQQEYDVIVVGGGSTGENAAWYARKNGLSAVVVESELIGGECSYWACMPSKALLRPGEVLAAARRVPAVQPAVTGEVAVEAALRSRDEFASDWNDESQAQWLAGIGVDVVRGRGRLAGERTVEVATEDGPPRLGAQEVTIVEMADRLLSAEEPFVGEELAEAFEAEGIRVLTGAKVTRAARESRDGPVTLTLDDGTEVVGDELLVAAGRRARTDDIGLETVGLSPSGYLEVDDRLRVLGVDGGWLYAAGDVNGRALLTHQGKYQARLAGDIIAGRDQQAWADHKALPRVTFTDPQVAAVGSTEQQARDAGLQVRAVRYDIGDTAGGALAGKGVKGTAQLVIDQDRRVIAGATFVGPGVGEMLHAATIAIVGEVGLERLWHAVPAFPTISEVWLRLLEADRGN